MKWLFIHDGRGPPDYPGVLDPDAKLHFGVEWRDYFGSDDPPQSITWDGGGLLAENELFYVTATINGENYKNLAIARLFGATEGERYTVTCTARTASGQIGQMSFVLTGGTS